MPSPQTHSEAFATRRAWASALLTETLDLWRNASVTEIGVFHPYLDRRWHRIEAEPRTLVSQTRLITNFSRGAEFLGQGELGAVARDGVSALQRYFLTAPGRYRAAVLADGSPQPEAGDSYGHAFAILALSTASRALHDEALAAAAMESLDYLSRGFRDGLGGLAPHDLGDRPVQEQRSQNPVMHSFEAMMALMPLDPSGRAMSEAQRTLEFVAGLADFRSGRLIEMFDRNWMPEAGGKRVHIDLGHAFEWAFLLSEWAHLAGDSAAIELGRSFLKTGCAVAIDTDGGVQSACLPDGQIVRAGKGLWQQCEGIRAVARYVARHGASDLEPTLAAMIAFYEQQFVDRRYGGVRQGPAYENGTLSWAKGDPWKLDYHSVNMWLELIESAEAR